MKEGDNIPEEILREWIEKAKPLVDSAWNLALDKAISEINDLKYGSRNEPLKGVTETILLITTKLSNLKKNIQQ